MTHLNEDIAMAEEAVKALSPFLGMIPGIGPWAGIITQLLPSLFNAVEVMSKDLNVPVDHAAVAGLVASHLTPSLPNMHVLGMTGQTIDPAHRY